MASDPVISVIVPFHDSATWLDACLHSLTTQDIDDHLFEIIAINNNSTDHSVAIVRKYPKVILISETIQGSYAARNTGLRHAKGRIAAFTDADCVAAHDWLSRMISAFDDEKISVVLGTRILTADNIILKLWSLYEKHKEILILNGNDSSRFYGHTNNMAVRRSAIEHHGYFHEIERGADTVMVRNIVKNEGVDALRYCQNTRVTHLEIVSGRSVLAKLFLYGRSSKFYRSMANAQPLTFTQRWDVYRQTIRDERLSRLQSLLLFAFLLIGMTFWTGGVISAALSGT
ncbi:MAG: glycosyltransferase [Granulosicoccus sp.]|nr:glycosyltransferase [Granulosicoccus sp.]